jgi:hypothetical protein
VRLIEILLVSDWTQMVLFNREKSFEYLDFFFEENRFLDVLYLVGSVNHEMVKEQCKELLLAVGE